MATYYISTTGSDSNNGTSISTPWLTIPKGNTSASSGDTINIAAGTYTWSSLSMVKTLTWVGAVDIYGRPATFLDGAGASVNWQYQNAGTQYFSNIQFQNVVKTTAQYVFQGLANGAQTFTNCRFTNIGIFNVGSGSGYCLFCSGNFGSACVFTFNNCQAWNIYTAPTSTISAYLTDSDYSVAANVAFIFNNFSFYHDATGTSALAGLFRRNGSALTVTTKNSIFASTSSITYTGPTVSTSTYTNWYNISSSPSGTGNITTNPLFVDGANGNFALRVNPVVSPAIDTGVLAP